MYVKAKGLKICKTILQKSFGAWGWHKLRKNVLRQPLQCKKIAVKCVIFFINKYFFILFYFIVIGFLYTKLKIYKNSYFQLNVNKYVLNKSQS